MGNFNRPTKQKKRKFGKSVYGSPTLFRRVELAFV